MSRYRDLEPLTPLGRHLAEIMNEDDLGRELAAELYLAAAARRRLGARIRQAITVSTIAAAAAVLAGLVGLGLFLHWADRGCPPGQHLGPSGVIVDVTPYKAEPVMACEK